MIQNYGKKLKNVRNNKVGLREGRNKEDLIYFLSFCNDTEVQNRHAIDIDILNYREKR